MAVFPKVGVFIAEIAASLLGNLIDQCARKLSPKAAANEFNRRAVLFNQNVHRFVEEVLLSVYPDLRNFLLNVTIKGREKIFPVVPLIKTFGPNGKGESILISPGIGTEKDVSGYDGELIEFIKNTGRNITEGPTYRLLEICESLQEAVAHKELVTGIGSYFRALSSCDKYYFNMVRCFPLKPSKFNLLIMRRRRLFRDWRQDISRIVELRVFNHISAAIGISVLTVFNTPGNNGHPDYKFICIHNSNEKNGANDRHVIPSFMYEPVTESRSEQIKELDIEYQVLREFAEEILGLGEFSGFLHRETLYKTLLQNEVCGRLHALLREGGACLEITGLYLDVMRLRPEITCALVIYDQDFYSKYVSEFKGSWEHRRQSVKWVSLTDRSGFEALLVDDETPLCPPGVAAVVSGRDYFIKELGLGRD